MDNYDVRWEQLLEELSDMSEIAEGMLQDAIKALNSRDIELAKEVINKDDLVDNYLITVEEQATRLLAMEQPLRSDVWNNIAAIKIASDLERVGDMAHNIAEIVLNLNKDEKVEPLIMIPELADLVLEMLDTVLEAFVTRNADLAEAVCRKDEEADNIYEQIFNSSIKLMDKSEGTTNISQIISFLDVAKSLERIGDHATNIGEETIFVVTGKRVKY
ncbi:MAG TPA: phosphate signaling complex protein PhoU [Halanaerobiaceae bacterium]|jgi:phosphate transport system protein|nr:phosphate signaling complex protein PhoU [Bacillota bacterium]HHU92756.1 phosphate signaling complex protein PhoU [Halanaerobiaceae bacterium]HOA41738.1 phosphate signaling complex protein PhoU [Halanaerobiales bacterium]HPZ62918.1 phosphate signaling complex protein PhoU [Halanaerobiales bacterium]HQD04083.1 phosphate signaling complex protein PhoU [Halanaerobiales bacterium]